GRVTKPPIHDVLRLAHFLRISSDEIQNAVFADTEVTPPPVETPARKERKKAEGQHAQGAVPLLEAAYRLLGWTDEAAAEALTTSPTRVRQWRTGAEPMKGGEARVADLAAAAQALGVRASRTPRE